MTRIINEYVERQEKKCIASSAETIQLEQGEESRKLYDLDDAENVLPENVKKAAGISSRVFTPIDKSVPIRMEVDTSVEQKVNSNSRDHESYEDHPTLLNYSKPNDISQPKLSFNRERPFRIEARDIVLRNFANSSPQKNLMKPNTKNDDYVQAYLSTP